MNETIHMNLSNRPDKIYNWKNFFYIIRTITARIFILIDYTLYNKDIS